MTHEHKLPDFDEFSRWLAQRLKESTIQAERDDTLLAARLARSGGVT